MKNLIQHNFFYKDLIIYEKLKISLCTFLYENKITASLIQLTIEPINNINLIEKYKKIYIK